MVSSDIDRTPQEARSPEGRASSEEKKKDGHSDLESPDVGSVAPNDMTQRKLKSRHIQLIGGLAPLASWRPPQGSY